MQVGIKKLSEVADVTAGQSPPSSTYNKKGNGLPFFQGKTDFGLIYPTAKVWCTHPKKVAYPNDILVSVRAPVGPVNLCKVESCIGRGLSSLSVYDEYSYEYLYFFLKSNQRLIQKYSSGSTFSAITKQDLKKIIITIPKKIEDQIRIAKVLTKAEELITKRKESILLLDELVKSTFLDMFGDPVKNEKGWESDKLENVAHPDCPLTYGIVQPGDEYPEGVPIVRPVDLTQTIIVREGLKLIDPKISNKYKRTILNGDEILMTVRGTTGDVAIASTDLKDCNVTRGIAPIWFDDKMKLEFAFHLFKTPQFQRKIKSVTKGIALKQINLVELRKLQIILPPDYLQDVFAKIANKLSDLKIKYESSLKELENLFGSLSQRAFKGELELSRVEVELPQAIQEEKELTNFQKMQILGAVINVLEADNQFYGEMILAKYLYLLDKLFNIKTGFKYKQWHFGPYDPELKRLLNSKQGFFKREKQYYYSLTKKEKLFKYDNIAVDKINKEFPSLLNVFNRYRNIDERKNKIELLASVCKVIEDKNSTNINEVLQGMNDWETNIKKTGFASKGEKFSKTEIERSLKFIIDKGFDEGLLN